MRFSIVMPTYNRGALLQYSLRTALEQSFDDYEVIVSNNCSTDDTESIVAAHADPRMKLIRPDERLSMVDHWEFAVSHARGDWVLILCDDDALLPGCLATLDRVARENPNSRLIQYDRFRYLYDDGIEDGGNFVDVGDRVSSSLIRLDSARRRSTLYWRLSLEMPKLLNSTAQRSLLNELRGRFGRVFGLWAPDVSVGVRMLSQTSHYLKTGPLMLWGETMQSYGSGSRRDPKRMLEFYKQFPEFEGSLPLSPYPELLTINNTIYDTLCRLRKELGDDGASLEIDPVRFRRGLRDDVQCFLERGHEEYRPIAEQLDEELKRLRGDAAHRWRYLKARIGELPEKFSRLTAGRRSTGRKTRHQFGNIHEAARFVGQLRS